MDVDFMKFSPVEEQIDSLKMITDVTENHGQDLSNSYLHYINPKTNFTIEDLSSNIVYCDNPHVTINAQVPISISRDESSSMPSLNDGNPNSAAAMREVIYRIASMQPIHIDPESVKPPKRRNVKISKDPQSVAARHRRERISERIRILQRLVPGGTKMDTASMLDEAVHYVKFLKNQVQSLERISCNNRTIPGPGVIGFPAGYEL